MEGETGSAFQIQTVNGLKYKTWFAGIGTGLDYYRFRTIPLFLDFRKYLFDKPGSPFIYADAGMHFAWVRDRDKNWYGESGFSNGLYYDIGLGYKKSVGKAGALLLSVGYSVKEMREKRIIMQCGFVPGCWESIERYYYDLKRLSIKVGWSF